MARLRIAVLFDNLGPYHLARMAALGKRADVFVIEFADASFEYDWNRVSDNNNFQRITLFSGQVSTVVSREHLICAIREALSRIRPDVIAIPGWSVRGALAAFDFGVSHGVPAVLMSESTAQDANRHWYGELVKRYLLSAAAGGIAGGTRSADYFIALGMPKERVVVGYDAVDNSYFAAAAAAARGKESEVRAALRLPKQYFVASCRFIEKKNLSRLLEAYAQYHRVAGETAWKLVIVGDGALKDTLIKARDKLGLERDVLFPGFAQYKDLPSYYGLAKVFVHASTVEQWGLVVNEAMASGLPVLVSDRCGCAPDLVMEGQNGHTFDPLDVAQMTRLMALMAARADLSEMGRASEKTVNLWSPERFADGMMHICELAVRNGLRRSNIVGRLLIKLLLAVK